MTAGCRVLLVGMAAVACLAGPARVRADAIDGNWCATDGRTFSIDGPKIITPDSTAAIGDYTRHGFAYVIPAGEAGAGTPVAMVLLDEQTLHLTAGTVPEIWHRCDVTS